MATAAFPRRLLGNTGLEVSVLGFGASPLGSVFEVCVPLLLLPSTAAMRTRLNTPHLLLLLLPQKINEAEGIASVHEAFRLGINFFDTSPFYGTTKSETVSAPLRLGCSCHARCHTMSMQQTFVCPVCNPGVQVLGKALKDLPRDKIIVATKVSRCCHRPSQQHPPRTSAHAHANPHPP
jgi:L-galactose dehydrogenase